MTAYNETLYLGGTGNSKEKISIKEMQRMRKKGDQKCDKMEEST